MKVVDAVDPVIEAKSRELELMKLGAAVVELLSVSHGEWPASIAFDLFDHKRRLELRVGDNAKTVQFGATLF